MSLFELFVGFRYLKSKKSQGFISFNTLLSLNGPEIITEDWNSNWTKHYVLVHQNSSIEHVNNKLENYLKKYQGEESENTLYLKPLKDIHLYSSVVDETAQVGSAQNVMIFTIIFSLVFGAGAIFILAWNASVIAAAIGIFSESDLAGLPAGVFRYMIHGFPEIAAYFIGALAGGIISIAVIRHDVRSDKFWTILQDSLNLIILAVIVLFIAALIEVFITPVFFL